MYIDFENKELNKAEEPQMGHLVHYTHNCMPFQDFASKTKNVPFNQQEWSNVLQLSERTFQRYKKENKTFESIYTEKILQIILLFNKGVQVFEDEDTFYEWLNSPVLALGEEKPINIIDNSFGIKMVKDILGRIEHGVYS